MELDPERAIRCCGQREAAGAVGVAPRDLGEISRWRNSRRDCWQRRISKISEGYSLRAVAAGGALTSAGKTQAGHSGVIFLKNLVVAEIGDKEIPELVEYNRARSIQPAADQNRLHVAATDELFLNHSVV